MFLEQRRIGSKDVCREMSNALDLSGFVGCVYARAMPATFDRTNQSQKKSSGDVNVSQKISQDTST